MRTPRPTETCDGLNQSIPSPHSYSIIYERHHHEHAKEKIRFAIAPVDHALRHGGIRRAEGPGSTFAAALWRVGRAGTEPAERIDPGRAERIGVRRRIRCAH